MDHCKDCGYVLAHCKCEEIEETLPPKPLEETKRRQSPFELLLDLKESIKDVWFNSGIGRRGDLFNPSKVNVGYVKHLADSTNSPSVEVLVFEPNKYIACKVRGIILIVINGKNEPYISRGFDFNWDKEKESRIVKWWELIS